MKAEIIPADLMPFPLSTPLLTSTAYGLTCLMAVAIFAAVSPPARMTGTARSCGTCVQSNVLPAAPVCLRLPGIQQKASGIGIRPDVLMQVGIRFHRDRLDERQAIPVAVIIGLMAMKLQQTQRDIPEDMPYPGWRGIDKQSNHRYEGGDGSRYPPGLLQRHMARTSLEENQANCIGAVFNGDCAHLRHG